MNSSPEQKELERLETEQSSLEEQVSNAELDYETMKSELARFQHRYYQKVGRLYAEADEWLAKIARVQAGYKPEDEFANQEAVEAEERARRSAEESGLLEKSPEPPAEITPELKKTYRQAAKLIHPDRATTDQERIRRNDLMAQVNKAYETGDLVAIQKLINEFGQDPEAIVGSDIASRLVKVIRRIAQIQRRLAEIDDALAELKSGELFELKTTVEESEEMGGDPLGDLAETLLQEISELKISYENHRAAMQHV